MRTEDLNRIADELRQTARTLAVLPTMTAAPDDVECLALARVRDAADAIVQLGEHRFHRTHPCRTLREVMATNERLTEQS